MNYSMVILGRAGEAQILFELERALPYLLPPGPLPASVLQKIEEMAPKNKLSTLNVS